MVGVGILASASMADQRAGLGTFRDPLAFEIADSAQGGIGLRDPNECGAGTNVAANCQDWNRNAGTAGRSADLVPIAALSGDDFKCADNFSITSAQTLTSICFWGFYGTTAGPNPGAFPTAGAEAFRIRVYGNSGGAEPGHPDSANILREWTVGANPGYGLTVDANTTLTRTGTGATRPGVFAWTVNLGASSLNLNPGCYWLEVVGATNGIVEGNRLRWVVVNQLSANNDGVFYQALNSTNYSYLDLVGGLPASNDLAFCLSFALNNNAGCNIPPAPTNNSCANAQLITAPFTATNVSTLRSVTPVAPFCGFNPINANTLWYRVAGNGQTFTARTCGTNTNFDTVINVYCGTCAGLFCVANNDTGPTTCTGGPDPSEVTWATVSGVDYYIAVFGFELEAGFLDFSLTSAAGDPGTACVTDRCPVDLTGVSPLEVDACGASTNSSCGGAGVGTFTLGDDFGGTSYNLGTTRDFDFWECASVIPDTVGDGTAWLDVIYSVEFPGIFNFFTGTCNDGVSNGTFLGGAFANYRDGGPACPRAEGPRTIQLNTAAGGPFRLNLLTVDFGGVTCASGENEYTILVRTSTLGACCIPASACFLTVPGDCADQGGNFLAFATSCGPTDPCTAPVQGACCRGTTCVLDTSANCPNQPNQSYSGDGTACNAPMNNTTPCCKADFNKSGTVTVQDIFDFLAAYFAANPLADINGGGTSVQDIFDYLAAYFAGCP